MTANGDGAVDSSTGSRLIGGVARLEGDERLDRWVSSLARPAGLVGNGRLRWGLSGKWLGHALHPLLTDFPLGCWIGSGLLDVAGGRGSRPAAQRLAGLGVLFAVPTAAAGLSDWAVTKSDRARRVGVVHAALNGVVATCYLLSWRRRRRDHHRSGVALAFAGGSLAWVSGYLGGHMSLRQQVGTGEPAVPIAVPAQ